MFKYIFPNKKVSFVHTIIFIVVLFFFKAFALLLFNYIGIVIRSDYEKETRNTLYSRMLKSNWSHLLKQKLGHLETLLMVDVRISTKLFAVISDSIMMATSLVMYLIVAVNISRVIIFMQ